MAQKTVIHKGYHGSIKVNMEDFTLFGSILFLDEEISYRGATFGELEEQFQNAVEEHIKGCRERGELPPFSE